MPQHVFFSWQSDTPNRLGRNFIEACLERAIGALRADAEVTLADREIAIDRDTRNVPGSPPIMDIIFAKIDAAAVFLADFTYVADRLGGGKAPNPNVSIEHGYALKGMGWRRVIAVMNTAFGHPDQHELPFDLRYARWPILFNLQADADADARRAAKDGLVRDLKAALGAILGDGAVQAALRGAGPAEPHPHDVELLERFHRQFPLKFRQFLHQHNFGNSFLLAKLDPLHEMNEDWVGAAYEFHDPAVQAAFSEVRRLASKFGDLVLERIYAMRGDLRMGWPKTDRDEEIGIQPGTEDAIKRLNTLAGELSSVIDVFERTARDHIRIATGVHAAALQAEAEQGAAERASRDAAEAAMNELAFDAHRGALPEIVTRPRVTLRLAPFAAAEGKRLDPRRMAEVQLHFPPNVDVRVKTDNDARQWWSCAPPRRPASNLNPETTWRMRLVRPGYVEYQATVGARIDNDPQILVDGRHLEALIVRTLERMGQIALALDLGGPALVSFSLDGIEDVELSQGRAGGRRIRQSELLFPAATVGDLSDSIAPAIHEQLDMLWQSAGWPNGSPSFGSGEWAGYADQRRYEPLLFGA
jgi:hypothetical protein